MFSLESVTAFVALSGFAAAGLVERQPLPSQTGCAGEFAIPLRLVEKEDPTRQLCSSYLLRGPVVTETEYVTASTTNTFQAPTPLITTTVDGVVTSVVPTATVSVNAIGKRQEVEDNLPPHVRAIEALGEDAISAACSCYVGSATGTTQTSTRTTTRTLTVTETFATTTTPATEVLTQTNIVGTTTVFDVSTVHTGTTTTTSAQPTGSSCSSFVGLSNTGFDDTAAGEEFPPWTHSETVVTTTDTSNSPPNSVQFDGLTTPSETFFVAQDLATCSGSTFDFSVSYVAPLVDDTDTCTFKALYGGVQVGISDALVTSNDATFIAFTGSFEGTGTTASFEIEASCASGNNQFLIYIDDVVVTPAGGSLPSSSTTTTSSSSTSTTETTTSFTSTSTTSTSTSSSTTTTA